MTKDKLLALADDYAYCKATLAGGVGKPDRYDIHDAVRMNDKARAALEAALDKALAPVDAEPVAWRFDQATYHEDDVRGRGWKVDQFSIYPPAVPWMQRNVVPLFAHPAPLREFSDDEIKDIALDHIGTCFASEVEFARAVLKAAGGGE